jgi:hypothetical protein
MFVWQHAGYARSGAGKILRALTPWRFTMNGVIAVVFFIFVAADRLLGR